MLRCIVLDDEQLALDVITDFIEKLPFLDLKCGFVDAFEALDFLQHHEIDLIIIDINMPDLSGLQFLKSLSSQPLVIFTTAYSEFAVESFEFNVVDYLLKPIKFDRFVKAVNKAIDRYKHGESKSVNIKNRNEDLILIKSGSKIHQVKSIDILYIESYGNYVKIYTKKEKLVSLLNMKQALEMLPAEQFAQIHKSYIVSLKHLTSIQNYQVKISDIVIPIGKVFKKMFFSKLGIK